MNVYDGTAAGAEERSHGPGSKEEVGGMGQREDVQASVNMQDGRERREVYGKRDRVGVRAGWRARLANVEFMLRTAHDWLGKETAHGEAQGRSCLLDALGEVRSMLDEIPQIGISQRAPVEVQPVRESER